MSSTPGETLGAATRAQPGAPVIVVVDATGIRPVATAAEFPALSGSAGFFWLDVIGDEPSRAEVLLQLAGAGLGFDEIDVGATARADRDHRISISSRGLRAATLLALPSGTATEVTVVCSQHCIVTLWQGPSAALDEARRQFSERVVALAANPFRAASVVLRLLLATLDQAISALDDKLQAIRVQLQRLPGASEVVALTDQLQRLQTRWVQFDRYSSTVRLAMVGIDAVPGMDDRGAAALKEYAEQVERTEQRLRERNQWASGFLQNYTAAIAQRQGEQINRLTLVSIIFLPLTFLTGFFGMNFGWMTQALDGAPVFVLFGIALPAACVALTMRWLHRRNLM